MIKIPKRLNDNHHFCKSNLKQIKKPFCPLTANPTKWSNTLKQFVCRRIV